MTPLWPRPSHDASRPQQAGVHLLAFFQGELGDVPFSAVRFGVPSMAAMASLEVQEIRDAAWLAGFRSGALLKAAQHDGVDLAALHAADGVLSIQSGALEPKDLGYLQSAWAAARWAVARGATMVLDTAAIRFHAGTAVAAAKVDAEFSLSPFFRLVVEIEQDAHAPGHMMHTRGMRNFGRPDILAVVRPEQSGAVGGVMEQLALQFALGALPPVDGPALEMAPQMPFFLVPYEPGDVLPDVKLNNAGVVLLGSNGRHMVQLGVQVV